MAKKSTHAEKEKRINQVYTLLLEGGDRVDILRYGSEKWGVSDRQIDDYVAWATRKLEKVYEKAQEHSLGKSLTKRNHLFMKAMASRNLNVAHEVLKDIDKLLNLYPGDQSERELGLSLAGYLRKLDDQDKNKKG